MNRYIVCLSIIFTRLSYAQPVFANGDTIIYNTINNPGKVIVQGSNSSVGDNNNNIHNNNSEINIRKPDSRKNPNGENSSYEDQIILQKKLLLQQSIREQFKYQW